jgi:hypothetical protein
MPRGFRRNWFSVEVSIIDHPKFMALSWAERGKWLVIRALAEQQMDTGGFTSREHLQSLLRKEGDGAAAKTVDRLVELRLLDIEADGSVVVHDYWQYRPGVSTDRVLEYRQRQRETFRNETKQAETPTDREIDREREITAPARAPAKGAAVAGNGQPTSMSDLLPNLPFMASGKAPLTKGKH